MTPRKSPPEPPRTWKTEADASPWFDAVDEARRLARRRLPGACVFVESREDRVLRYRPDRGWIRRSYRSAGAQLWSAAAGTSCFLAAPSPAGFLETVSGYVRTGSVSWPSEAASAGAALEPRVEADPEAIETFWGRWLEHVQALHPVVRWNLDWIAHRQDVWVAGADKTPRVDHRIGERLQIRLERPGTRARVVDWTPANTSWSVLESRLAAALDALEVRREAAAPRGPVTAVLAPGVAGILVHELVGHALEEQTLAMEASWISAHRPAAPVAPWTVMDDPAHARSPWRVDDTGVETSPAILVERGRPRHGLGTSAGNAGGFELRPGFARRASFRDPVRARMGCTYLTPGSCSPEAILRETAAGVYIERLVSAFTDTVSGRAVFAVEEARRIRRGRLEERLEPFVFEVRGGDLEGLDLMGGDLQFDACVGACVEADQALPTSVGAPTCRLRLITVFPGRTSKSEQ